jgi:hypothetical protein
MQTYPLKLSPSNATVIINVEADLFVYESGDAGAGDTRISVKPDNGAEIILRPGQRFRIQGTAQRWSVSLKDPAVTLNGSIIIGSGEFDDANTLNKVTLDASFANNVTIMNGPGARVPVSLDPTQSLALTVAYTNSYTSNGATLGVIQVVAPGTNVNGVIVEFAEFTAVGSSGASDQYGVALLAKAGGAPVSVADGADVLLHTAMLLNNNPQGKDIMLPNRVKVAAGKGLYLIQYGTAGLPQFRLQTVLYTVL